MVAALHRLGRDTPGLLDLIKWLASMSGEVKVLDLPADVQIAQSQGVPESLVRQVLEIEDV